MCAMVPPQPSPPGDRKLDPLAPTLLMWPAAHTTLRQHPPQTGPWVRRRAGAMLLGWAGGRAGSAHRGLAGATRRVEGVTAERARASQASSAARARLQERRGGQGGAQGGGYWARTRLPPCPITKATQALVSVGSPPSRDIHTRSPTLPPLPFTRPTTGVHMPWTCALGGLLSQGPRPKPPFAGEHSLGHGHTRVAAGPLPPFLGLRPLEQVL